MRAVATIHKRRGPNSAASRMIAIQIRQMSQFRCVRKLVTNADTTAKATPIAGSM